MARKVERGEAARCVEVVRARRAGRAGARPRTSRSTKGRPSRAHAAGRRARAGRARGRSSAANAGRPEAGRRAPGCRRLRSRQRAVPKRPGPGTVPGTCPSRTVLRRGGRRRPLPPPPLRRKPRPRHYFCCPCVSSAPLNGSATYGNWLIAAVSPSSTPSPSGSLWPRRKPPTACSAMSTTSSLRRRPFGQP